MAHGDALDDTDRAILDLLRQDARRTVSDIAERVNLSPAPVKRRIDRLERIGVIAGYTVVLDHGKVGPSIEAYTELRFVGDTDVDDILTSASELPEVLEVFAIAGDPDALVRVRVEDMEHLQRVVNELRRSGNVTGTKTLIVMGHWSRGE
jgi:Lrp/AsnC family transcriptional regulator, leucine-responsive regulatory protein